MRTKWFGVVSLLIVAGLILAACAPAAGTPVVQTVIVEGEVMVVTATPEAEAAGPKTLRYFFGPGDVPTLDPGLATDTSSVQIINMGFVGLTYLDEVVVELFPGIAESWEVCRRRTDLHLQAAPGDPVGQVRWH